MTRVIPACSFLDLPRMRHRFVQRILLAGAAFACTQCEPTATFAVTKLTDGGEGSLRSAIGAANSSSSPEVRIELPPGTYELTRCGASDDSNHKGDLDVTRAANVTIVAPNGGATIRQTCPGERVLDVLGEGHLTLSGIRITGGALVATGPGEDALGGGVRAAGDVTLVGAVITGNSARAGAGSAAASAEDTVAGGAARGGGLYVGGALTSQYPTFITLNTATGGGGVAAAAEDVPAAGGAAEGGGVYVVGAVTLSGGGLSRNMAVAGRGGDAVVPAAGGSARGGGLAQADTSTAPVDVQSLEVFDNVAHGGESGGHTAAVTNIGPAGSAGAAEGGGLAVAGPASVRFATALRNHALGGSTGIGEQPFIGGQGRSAGSAGPAFGGALASKTAVTVNGSRFELNVAASGDTFFFCASFGCAGGSGASAWGGAVYTPETAALTGVHFVENSARRGTGNFAGEARGGAVVSNSLEESGGVYSGNAARTPATSNGGGARGGAISAEDVELSGSRFDSNNAAGPGGAVDALTLSALGLTASSNRAGASGGAIHVRGDALVEGATVRHNAVESQIESGLSSLVGGGGISVGGTLTINDSWVANNTGHASVVFSNPRLGTFIIPARFLGGGARANRLVARGVTFSGNQAIASTITSTLPLPVSPGVSGGGGIAFDDTAELVNVTLADNATLPDPGFINTSYGLPPEGAAMLGGNVSLDHVTLIDNQGAASIQVASLTAQRSVAVPAADASVCGAGVVSGASAFNWFADASCALIDPTNRQESAAFQLGSLAQAVSDRPPVRAPQTGSVLIDAIPTASCPTPDDANGTPRPQGAACDIGAVEVRL